ncbi:hypothetical protein E8E14_006011 [Neopestalotiopsis sp. 37M]|nr:hypothetical protein E8E14_006011 [Neopestalotiopsis sp. 37M]
MSLSMACWEVNSVWRTRRFMFLGWLGDSFFHAVFGPRRYAVLETFGRRCCCVVVLTLIIFLLSPLVVVHEILVVIDAILLVFVSFIYALRQ